MYVKTEDVKEAIKKYFHDLIDIGKKEVDVVDGALELQEVVDKVPGIGWIRVEDKLPVMVTARGCKVYVVKEDMIHNENGEG